MAFAELFDNQITANNNTPLSELLETIPSRPGVCMLATSDDKPILILYGTNLKLQVKRRLEPADSTEKSKKADLRPLVANIYYKMSYSKFITQLDYFAIVRSIYPTRWHKLFPRLNCWFIVLDKNATVPVFKVTDKPSALSEKCWGPYATKTSAERLLETMVIVCGLCRNNKNLAQVPHATPCSYAQMKLCPVVCDGTMPLDDYNKLLENAGSFLSVTMTDNIERLEQQIKVHASQLEFELAEKLHRNLQLCRKMLNPVYKWSGPMNNYHIISFQPDQKIKIEGTKGKQPGIRPVIIRPEGAETLPPFALNKSQDVCRELLTNIKTEKADCYKNLDYHLLAWLTQLLNRSDRQKGLFIPVNSRTTAAELTTLLEDYFATAKLGLEDENGDNISLQEHPDDCGEFSN